MKIHRRRITVAIITIIGLFSPWITKPLDPIGVIDPNTGQGHLTYQRRILLSPFYIAIMNEGILSQLTWFISTGTTIAGLMVFIASIISSFKFKASIFNASSFLFGSLGIVFFFMSLGTGLGIGLRTDIGIGLIITIIGVGLMFASTIIDLSRDPKLRVMTH